MQTARFKPHFQLRTNPYLVSTECQGVTPRPRINPPVAEIDRLLKGPGPTLRPFSSVTMAATSGSDDLTIPELFHALKQRLCGISVNCIGCAVLLFPRRTRVRVMLTWTVSSNSSGLDLQEVRKSKRAIEVFDWLPSTPLT